MNCRHSKVMHLMNCRHSKAMHRPLWLMTMADFLPFLKTQRMMTWLLCAQLVSCCDPNSNTKEYCFCVNCNIEAHTICTKQMNFQTPALDKLVITPKDFLNMGKERFKKSPLSKHQNVVFCLLCKACMIQKKLHPTQKLVIKKKLPSADAGTPRQPKRGRL